MTTQTPAEHSQIEQEPAARLRRRRPMPAGRVFVVILVTLLVWAVLYAPELKRSAQAAPLGTRRSIALAILSPLAWISDQTRLTTMTDAASRAAGRDPNAAVGDVNAGVDDLPTPTKTPTKPPKDVVKDTKVREPTPDKQLRVAVVGDSLAQGIGFATADVFKPFWTEVFKQGRISTGLARLDYFNWMAEMRTIVDRADPDLVVVMLGENDNQGLLKPDGTLEQDIGTFPWAGAYEGRVERFAKIATERGAHVIWVGLPNERDRDRWDFIQRQNGIFKSVADRLPNVAYFDTWNTFAAPDGSYNAYYREGNKVVEIRAGDGVHFNADGYELLMRKVAEFTTQEFKLNPKTYGE
jgi:uncharacterized protein